LRSLGVSSKSAIVVNDQRQTRHSRRLSRGGLGWRRFLSLLVRPDRIGESGKFVRKVQCIRKSEDRTASLDSETAVCDRMSIVDGNSNRVENDTRNDQFIPNLKCMVCQT
jgi:hypothetical protein